MGLFTLNYNRPGKGVSRDGPQPKRFFLFFQLYFRQFWKIIGLNLLYLLFCIPIVTIGPATAAMTKVAKYLSEDRPVFLWSDFCSAFKSNFRQSFFAGLINTVLFVALGWAIHYYIGILKVTKNAVYYLPLCFVGFLLLLVIFANFYLYLEIITVDLPLSQLMKNSVLLAFLGVKTNFITLFFSGLVVVPSILYFPTTVLFVLLLTFSTASMIICYNSFQYVYRYMVKPYYNLHPELKNPYEPAERAEE